MNNQYCMKRLIITIAVYFISSQIMMSASFSKETHRTKLNVTAALFQACKIRWPGLALDQVKADQNLKKAKVLYEKAGEHPNASDMNEIVRLYQSAAEFGLLEAQKNLGFYVVGYWMTDEFFWPKKKKIAIHALAMLRLSAIRDFKQKKIRSKDPFLKALSWTPPQFNEATYELPKAWLQASLQKANDWEKCFDTKRSLANRRQSNR